MEGSSNVDVKNVPENDVNIYKTWASGAWKNVNKSRSVELGCAILEFKPDGDGKYEISIKTGELYHKASRNENRTFSIILNDLYIVKEFTLERYRVSPNGLELNANFKISSNGDFFQLQGHVFKRVERSDKKLELEICHSNCGHGQSGFNVDRSWVMYGLSIVKFKHPDSFKLHDEEINLK